VLCGKNEFTVLFRRHRGYMGKCASCGLVQVIPMLEKREVDALYDDDFVHFTPYIEQLFVHHRYFRMKLMEIGRDLSGKRLLDIGCAMGVLLKEAKKKGMRAVGIDISAGAVSYCRRQNLQVYQGTIPSLRKNLKPESFDIVTAFQVIEHERDPLKMAKRIYLLLKKNGIIVLATPNYGGWWRRLMGRRWFGFAHPEHLVLFDFKTMKLLLEKAGFRFIEIRTDNPRPFPLSFVFTRGADYFPCLRGQAWVRWALKPIGNFLDRFDVTNPINPWDDMIAIAKK
jgi:2-polyprenyl-3-methyl-5-hydroxy-6-metoxy-1,4-benzoquinol methylase